MRMFMVNYLKFYYILLNSFHKYYFKYYVLLLIVILAFRYRLLGSEAVSRTLNIHTWILIWYKKIVVQLKKKLNIEWNKFVL